MSLAQGLCLRLLSARTLTALRRVLLQAQRKQATFFLPDWTATGGWAAVASSELLGGWRSLRSPISASSSAAVTTLLGSRKSERKMGPSGCSLRAPAIWLVSRRICSTSGLSAAARAGTAPRRGWALGV